MIFKNFEVEERDEVLVCDVTCLVGEVSNDVTYLVEEVSNDITYLVEEVSNESNDVLTWLRR